MNIFMILKDYLVPILNSISNFLKLLAVEIMFFLIISGNFTFL